MMWQVRPETADDLGAVRRVHELAFAPRHEEADLVEALRAASVHVPQLCLVACHGGSVVGHIAFSRAELDSGHPVLALAPMGVLPEHQRRGVGSALVREGLRRAGETDFPLVVVLGHPTYYPRFGFEPAERHGVSPPFEVPREAWMAFALPASRPDARGRMVYPEPFDAL